MSELKAELQHERLTCRQMKNEIEKIQVIPVTCLFTLFPWTADVVVFITVNFHTFPWSFDVVVFNILNLHTFPWSFDVVVFNIVNVHTFPMVCRCVVVFSVSFLMVQWRYAYLLHFYDMIWYGIPMLWYAISMLCFKILKNMI